MTGRRPSRRRRLAEGAAGLLLTPLAIYLVLLRADVFTAPTWFVVAFAVTGAVVLFVVLPVWYLRVSREQDDARRRGEPVP